MKLSLKIIRDLRADVGMAPNQFTVLYGGNNSGETYAIYVLWALLHQCDRSFSTFTQHVADQLKSKGNLQKTVHNFFTQHLAAIEKAISSVGRQRLHILINAPSVFFIDALALGSLNLPTLLQLFHTHKSHKRTGRVGMSSTLDLRLKGSDHKQFVALVAIDASIENLNQSYSSIYLDLRVHWMLRATHR